MSTQIITLVHISYQLVHKKNIKTFSVILPINVYQLNTTNDKKILQETGQSCPFVASHKLNFVRQGQDCSSSIVVANPDRSRYQ